MSVSSQRTRKICIVGAGSSGIVAAKYLAENPENDITIFESKDNLGGLWYYEEKNVHDPKFEEEKRLDNYYKLYGCFQASIYKNLQSNIPHYLMCFKDFNHLDVDSDTPDYINIDQHNKYLHAYTDKFGLKRLMKFNTLVKSIRLYKNLTPEERAEAPGKRKFVVKTAPARDNFSSEQVHAFDYVIVCSGVNSKPHIPEIPGQEKFTGTIMTSKDYRRPDSEEFKRKTILLYGGSYSSLDLVVQLLAKSSTGTQEVNKIIYVGRKVKQIKKAEDWKEYIKAGQLEVLQGEVAEFSGEKTVKLSNGMTREVDTFVFCCGYEISLPFFDLGKDRLFDFNPKEHSAKFISPIYKRMFSVREPSMMVLYNSDVSSVGAFIAESQAMVAKYVIEGKLKLPSKEEMKKNFEDDIEDLVDVGQPLRKFMTIPTQKNLDFRYWIDLRNWVKTILPSDEEKGENFTECMIKLSEEEEKFFESGNLISYRKHNFKDVYDPRKFKYTSEFV